MEAPGVVVLPAAPAVLPAVSGRTLPDALERLRQDARGDPQALGARRRPVRGVRADPQPAGGVRRAAPDDDPAQPGLVAPARPARDAARGASGARAEAGSVQGDRDPDRQ